MSQSRDNINSGSGLDYESANKPNQVDTDMPMPSAQSNAQPQYRPTKQAPSDPNLQILEEIGDNLESVEIEWVKQKLEEKDKKIVTTFKCYVMTKDKDDLINSLQRLYKKAAK